MADFDAFAASDPQPCLLVDRHGVITAANTAARRAMKKLFPGSGLMPIASSPGAVATYLDQCCRTRGPVPGFLELQNSDGLAVGWHCYGGLLAGPSGATPASIILRLRPMVEANLSFRQLTQQITDLNAALRRSEAAKFASARLAAIVESSNDAIIGQDLEGTISTWNRGATSIFGYTPSEMIGQSSSPLVPPSRKAEQEELLSRVMGGESITEFETVWLRKNGRPVELSMSLSPIKDPAGNIIGASKVARDITERKAAERFVAQQAALIDLSSDAIITRDLNGTISSWNAGATALYGYSSEDAVGRAIHTLLQTRFPRPLPDILEILQREKQWTGDLVHHTRDGHELTVLSRWKLDEGAASTEGLILEINTDITERNRMQEHARLLMEEVNHRAKNLLGVVLAVARQTARSGDSATFVERLSDRIAGLAASHDLLVQNLWRGVELADLVSTQLSHFQDLIGERVLIDGPRIYLKPQAAQGIGMALHELATNAGKYGALSGQFGRVRISWELSSGRDPVLLLTWQEEDGPKVVAPARQGFGHVVIGRMVESSVHGKAELQYREGGLLWKLAAPASDSLGWPGD